MRLRQFREALNERYEARDSSRPLSIFFHYMHAAHICHSNASHSTQSSKRKQTLHQINLIQTMQSTLPILLTIAPMMQGWSIGPRIRTRPDISTKMAFQMNNCDEDHEDTIDIATQPKKLQHRTRQDVQQQQQEHKHEFLDLSVLLVDNYDSYTYNLYQHLATFLSVEPKVVKNDDYGSWQELLDDLYTTATADNDNNNNDYNDMPDCVILGPGPGTPCNDDDMGICLEILRSNPTLPIFGVCLGHQALAHVHGATIQRATTAKHGLLSEISYNLDNDGTSKRKTMDVNNACLFQNIPNHFNAVRYHSLVVAPHYNTTTGQISINNNLEVLAVAQDDAEIMALKHVRFPHYGVQFHPESVGTEYGLQLMYNFCEFAVAHNSAKGSSKRMANGFVNVDVDVDSADRVNCIKRYQPERLQRRHDSWMDEKNGNARKLQNNDHHHSSSSLPPPSIEDGNYDTPRISATTKTKTTRCYIQKLTNIALKSHEIFHHLYASNLANHNIDDTVKTFWLDSTKGYEKMNGRFSMMGNNASGKSHTVEYFIHNKNNNNNVNDDVEQQRELRICGDSSFCNDVIDRYNDEYSVSRHFHEGGEQENESSSNENETTVVLQGDITILDFLDNLYCDNCTYEEHIIGNDGDIAKPTTHDDDEIPFDYRGGYVGYLGYEVRHDTDPRKKKRQVITPERAERGTDDDDCDERPATAAADAAFLYADQSIVFDHRTNDVYLISLADGEEDAREWMDATIESLSNIVIPSDVTASAVPTEQRNKANPRELDNIQFKFKPSRSREVYERNIEQCREYILNGESYEICLTNHLTLEAATATADYSNKLLNPYKLYQELRSKNPAPFSAFLNLGRNDMSVCCSSPERFLNIDKEHWMESKPIKGTTRRSLTDPSEDANLAHELRRCPKNRAENLMIVDLVRNDFGQVCDVGSVHVSKLMQVETFATVHQLVSTIRGRLLSLSPENDDENNQSGATLTLLQPVDAIRACFPGGSMTGAPKWRTLDIIDELEEQQKRGVYSGSIGYLSPNGCMDLNIVIRTAIVTRDAGGGGDGGDGVMSRVSVGAGGAITMLSVGKDEYEEMMLKGSAIVRAVSSVLDDNR